RALAAAPLAEEARRCTLAPDLYGGQRLLAGGDRGAGGDPAPALRASRQRPLALPLRARRGGRPAADPRRRAPGGEEGLRVPRRRLRALARPRTALPLPHRRRQPRPVGRALAADPR